MKLLDVIMGRVASILHHNHRDFHLTCELEMGCQLVLVSEPAPQLEAPEWVVQVV